MPSNHDLTQISTQHLVPSFLPLLPLSPFFPSFLPSIVPSIPDAVRSCKEIGQSHQILKTGRGNGFTDIAAILVALICDLEEG